MIKQMIRKVFKKAFYRKPLSLLPGRNVVSEARVWSRLKNGKCQLHRFHGPAIEYSDGAKSWYYDGEHCFTDFGDTKPVGGRAMIQRIRP